MQNENIISNDLILNNDASLKEYYIKLQSLYNNAVNMLTAINQSLYSNTAEVEVSIATDDNTSSVLRIPSFLYLESKLEEMSSNLDAIFNIPKDGEAWFTKSENMYKLNLVRSNIAPLTPNFKISENTLFTSYTDNNIFKDMVLPKMFIRVPLSNIPSNISKVLMKKITINNFEVFEALKSKSVVNGKYSEISYNDCKDLLYLLTPGVDYDEYESVIDLPIKKDYYKSRFVINYINSRWTSVINDEQLYVYEVKFDTLTYYNEEDSSIQFTLKAGDLLCLGNEMTVFKVKAILGDNTVQLEQYIGYTDLQTYSENNQMVFKIYVSDYSKFDYVDLPLEENQYNVVFVSTIWNNVRSVMSSGLLIDLGSIVVKDEYGNVIYDNTGKEYNYMAFYNNFCNNIGDIFTGISKTIYSQLSNYTTEQLNQLLNDSTIKSLVSNSINNENLSVIEINKHLIDDLNTDEIINLHNQKNELNSALQTCQTNIDQVYSTMLSTDFSQNVTISRQSLQDQINGFYTERTNLQKQLIAIIDNINSKSTFAQNNKPKYRVRGVTSVDQLSNYISTTFSKAELIGIDIEYKYRTTFKDTNLLNVINNSTFTDWNKQYSIEKERKLVFTDNNSFIIQYVDYSDLVNIIKWNQIDIPISSGEDVIIRVRYKYSIGQPFINLYTPWSDELVITFPVELTENATLSEIVESNTKDSVSATFSKTLINDGYAEHIQNKILTNERVFFHMPENIYSGFNTPENNLISLKDKLIQLENDISKYKSYIDDLTNSKYEVYLVYDNISTLLTSNAINKINIYNTEHILELFIKKDMNIVIKNTGNADIKLYSIFPGNTSTYLITANNDYFAATKGNYERVPLYVNNELSGQTLNQFIYFRSTNPFTSADIYYNTVSQNALDYWTTVYGDDSTTSLSFMSSMGNYISKDNKQILLGFRNNLYLPRFDYTTIKNTTTKEDIMSLVNTTDIDDVVTNRLGNFNWFIYDEYITSDKLIALNTNGGTDNNGDLKNKINKYIGRFEDIVVYDNDATVYSFADAETPLETIKNTLNTNIVNNNRNTKSNETDLTAAFLYPNIISKSEIIIDNDKINETYKVIKPGETLNIPVTFEFCTSNDINKITKSLYFDLKPSLVSDPTHYMVEITGHNDYSRAGIVYNNMDEIKNKII